MYVKCYMLHVHNVHILQLSRLEHLSIAANPCIEQPAEIERQWDYRPYVINWCLGLRTLDGMEVGARESLKVGLLLIYLLDILKSGKKV